MITTQGWWDDLHYSSPREHLTVRTDIKSVLISLWCFLPILIILVGACHGVAFLGFKITRYDLDTAQNISLALCIVGFVLVEGYMGFFRSWSPATARRCLIAPHITGSATVLALGPLFGLGFFCAPRRRLFISYILPPCIYVLVLMVKTLDSPWHEIVDIGVFAGLATGEWIVLCFRITFDLNFRNRFLCLFLFWCFYCK